MGCDSLPLPEFHQYVASGHSALLRLLSTIPTLPLRYRKVVLDFSRIQPQSPLVLSRFYSRNVKYLDLPILHPDRLARGEEPDTLLQLFCDLVDSPTPPGPVTFGLLAQCAICLPGLGDTEVAETQSDALYKEISASQSYLPAKLDYRPWFEYGAHDLRLHPELFPKAGLHRTIYSYFHDFKIRFSGRLLFPKIGRV